MINIVHYECNFNDQRKITSIKVVLKCITEEGKELLPMHPLVATVSASFNSTTLLTDVGESYKITPDPKRSGDVIDLKVRIKENYNLSYEDIARFLEAFQAALDTTKLF